MKKRNLLLLIALLTMTAAAIYWLQVALFHTPSDTAFYFLQDIAFLPLQVAIVTVVLGTILTNREKQERLRKTNMAVGAFFSELGNTLLSQAALLLPSPEELGEYLKFSDSWTLREFREAAAKLEQYDLKIECGKDDLQRLKDMLIQKRNFMLLVLENPNLLEHETFTDLLWAIFHLTDELLARESMQDLPDADIAHLKGDVKRALKAVLIQWVGYIAHLKTDYPYLFSLELRRNPFKKDNSVIFH